MHESREGGVGGSLLAYFGLESGDRAWATLLWAAPYLLLLGGGLGAVSLAVHWLFPLPGWVHAVAFGLALAYFFLFLARLRRAAADAERAEREGEGAGPGAPPRGRGG